MRSAPYNPVDVRALSITLVSLVGLVELYYQKKKHEQPRALLLLIASTAALVYQGKLAASAPHKFYYLSQSRWASSVDLIPVSQRVARHWSNKAGLVQLLHRQGKLAVASKC